MTVMLKGESVTLGIEPDCGGAITSLTFGETELLAAVPWSSASPAQLSPAPDGRLDEGEWVAQWQGGWQALLPNAGASASRFKPPQGFHGNASVAPWRESSRSARGITLSWSDGEAWEAVRSVSIQRDTVRVEGSLKRLALPAECDAAPFVVTEHLILGGPLLLDGARIEIDADCSFVELNSEGRPSSQMPQKWPGDTGRGDTACSWDSVSADRRTSRVGVVSGVDSVRVILGREVELDVRWCSLDLPYLWVWQELGGTLDKPWNGSVFALGIEPSSAPHAAGLDHEMDRAGHPVVHLGESFSWTMEVAISSSNSHRASRSNGAGNGSPEKSGGS